MILFIIDCSYTMSQQKFTISNILVSRKDALAQDLIKCLKTLRNDQNFNVLKFNLKCVSYSNTCVQATPINIEKAVQFLEEEFMDSYTDISVALQKAFQTQSNIDKIILVCGSTPNHGITDFVKLKEFVEVKINSRYGQYQIPVVNTVVFMVGGEEIEKERDDTYKVCLDIAA